MRYFWQYNDGGFILTSASIFDNEKSVGMNSFGGGSFKSGHKPAVRHD